jgi:hypothetical protein
MSNHFKSDERMVQRCRASSMRATMPYCSASTTWGALSLRSHFGDDSKNCKKGKFKNCSARLQPVLPGYWEGGAPGLADIWPGRSDPSSANGIRKVKRVSMPEESTSMLPPWAFAISAAM